MFIRSCKRLLALLGKPVGLLVIALFLFGSLALTAQAVLTVSSGTISSDGNLNLTVATTSVISLQGGNVGIGTTTPSYPLVVEGDVGITGALVNTSLGSAFGSLAIPNNDTTFPYPESGTGFSVLQNTSATGFDYNSSLFFLKVDSDGSWINNIVATQLAVDVGHPLYLSQDTIYGEGHDVTTVTGHAVASFDLGSVNVLTGYSAYLAPGTRTDEMFGFKFGTPGNGAATTMYGFAAYPDTGSTILTAYDFYGLDLNGVATNSYYSWFDSRGVRRVKEDNTFNGVGQAIEALYNPQFTKYTPGATDYERVVLGEWNSNVAQIGTENGGTGSARALAFLTGSSTRMTISATGNVSISTTTFSSIGTCSAGAEGSMRPVTDSATSTLGATISAGGSSNHVLAYCDGTNWTVMAK